MSGLTSRGVPELVSGLEAVADGLDELTAGPEHAAETVTARAKALAPKRTGALAKSIRGTANAGRAEIGTAIPYGAPVHFGVPSRNQRPQPFLFQAVDAEQSEIIDGWAKDVQALIDRKIR